MATKEPAKETAKAVKTSEEETATAAKSAEAAAPKAAAKPAKTAAKPAKAEKAEKAATPKADKAEKAEKAATPKADKPAAASAATSKAASTSKSIEVKNQQGAKIGTTKLDESVFGVLPNIHVMHEVVRAQMAAARQGTHDTKTRGQVSGGGKKPYRQKGTGRARQGTIRAPQYVGGGTVFGPHPRSYAFKVNNREVKLAMRSALSVKRSEGVLHILDTIEFEKPSTKQAVDVLKALGIEGRLTLVVADNDINTFLSFRNLGRVRVIGVSESNTYDLIDNKALVLTKAALARIEEVLQ
jgi:large subunit ribosomal protein L4